MRWRWTLGGFGVVLVGAATYAAVVLVHLARVMTTTVVIGEEMSDDLDAIVARLTLVLRPKESSGHPRP